MSSSSVIILDELGYSPIINSDTVVSNATKKALDIIGESPSNALLRHLSSLYDLPEKEILAQFKLIEAGLKSVFKEGAEIFLEQIKQEILRQVRSKNTSKTVNKYLVESSMKGHQSGHYSKRYDAGIAIGDILHDFLVVETFEFIRNLPSHEHIVFLYENEQSRDAILSEFLDQDNANNAPSGLFSVRPTKLPSVSNMLYSELLHIPKSLAMKKMSDWIGSIHLQNKSEMPTRIAGEDTWFFENNFNEEILMLENAIGGHVKDNMNILCTYDITKVAEKKTVKSLIQSHSYVILDEPFMIYKKQV